MVPHFWPPLAARSFIFVRFLAVPLNIGEGGDEPTVTSDEMSGVEVAGLVLGAFPILIHALESYQKGAEVLKDWWKIERTHKKCKQDLKYHKILFEGNIERFLLPLVVDDDELKMLMADPAGVGWEDQELEVRLKERLPKSYDLFLDIMGSINELVEELKKELGVHNSKLETGLNQAGKSKASRIDILSISNVEFQAKRLKFSLKRSSRERLFSQLQDANDRMRNLLESSDQITAARRGRESSKPPSILNKKINEFWQHAKRLHEALSKAWQCGCGSHAANLLLQHRTSDKIEFDVLFDLGSKTRQRFWRETKIKMVHRGASTTAVGVTITVPQSSQTTTLSQRQMQWLPPSPSCEPSPAALASAGPSQMSHIKDLCSTLSTHCPDCFGFLDEDEHRFLIYPVPKSTLNKSLVTVTLDSLLHNAHSLTRRKRYFLALTLASSYLQLSSTPWLDSPLRKDNIVFLQESSDPDSAHLECPYIRCEILNRSSRPSTDAISSLGIRLLELCFGVPLENNKFRKQMPAGDATLAPMFDYAAAIQWSKMVSEEAGPEFAEAIEWCLHAKELSDGSWRKELWTHVIAPLDACYKQVAQKPVLS